MTSKESALHLSEPENHIHPAPSLSSVDRALRGIYSPAPQGEPDVNLLILFHGLGDTAAPFAGLAKSLNLPQTATLSLSGPMQVPLLEEEACQWVHSFDELGELITNPNPTSTLQILLKLLNHLTSTSPGAPAWKPSSISLFGFAQGGSIASELALTWGKSHPLSEHLGSLVSVSGPLFSHPTTDKKVATKVLTVMRKGEERIMGVGSFTKGYENVQEVVIAKGEGMPRNRDEWEQIMRFWAANLKRKSALELSGNVYEIRGGAGATA